MAAEDRARRPLWAPWRVRFIRGEAADGCFLCAAARPADDSERYVIHRGDHAVVLLNAFPYNAGHLLVAPRRHVADLAALEAAERLELFDLFVRAQQALNAAMQPQGFNLGCNLGRVAGAGVPDHLHWHVVPRWLGDTNFMPVLADVDCVPEALEATADLLRQHWQ